MPPLHSPSFNTLRIPNLSLNLTHPALHPAPHSPLPLLLANNPLLLKISPTKPPSPSLLLQNTIAHHSTLQILHPALSPADLHPFL